MIIIDTNIISEMMKPTVAHQVLTWLNQQDNTQLFVTSITIAEICYGLNVLPKGNRRNLLESAFHKAIMESFQYRILFFDDSAAFLYGKIMGQRKQLGRPLSIADGQIAAIASVHGFSLATRNIKDFNDCNIELIDPFERITIA